MATYSSFVEDATASFVDAVKQFEVYASGVVDAAGRVPASTVPALPGLTEVLTANFAAADRVLAVQKGVALGLAGRAPVWTAVPSPAVPSSVEVGAAA